MAQVQTVPVRERLGRGLGWFSVGLGLPQPVAPDRGSRLVGVEPTTGTKALMRVVGLRELGAAAGILGGKAPAGWLWGRVAGDAKDLALLGVALASKDSNRRRVLAATAAVAGVTVLDVVAGVRRS